MLIFLWQLFKFCPYDQYTPELNKAQTIFTKYVQMNHHEKN